MTSEQRKSELARIQDGTPSMTGITLTYHGERRQFNAYDIPLSILKYNPYNGRIGAEVKSYERQHHVLNPDNQEDIAVIEKFLWDSRPDANQRTFDSLIIDHQQKFGIVTADGKIIDGNRRASILNKIWRDPKIPTNEKLHCQFFQAIILPTDADKKEILRLETIYQMGEDAKVDYGPIEKYLKAGDLADENISNEEIASCMGITTKEVSQYLRVLKLMNDYLDEYGYTGIYTMLEGREDSFLKLEAALRGYTSGGVSKMWGYDAESDVSDLKTIAFDYIRMGLDQQDFRDIIRKPTAKKSDTASFFANEEVWSDFSEAHFAATETVSEVSVDDLVAKNPNGELKRLMKARDEKWREAVAGKMRENFGRMRDKILNKEQSAEPLKLLTKALMALSSVDANSESFKNDMAAVSCLDQILQLATEYKKQAQS